MKKIWFQTVGIDFGSENLRICWDGANQIEKMPSYVAIDAGNKVLAVGEDARALAMRAREGVKIVKPISRGIIQDEAIALILARSLLGSARWRSWLFAPIMMMAVPSNATKTQRERAVHFMKTLGARKAIVLPHALAAAIGAGVPSQDSAGSVIVQMGAGTIEAAAISLGGVVSATNCEFAGTSLLLLLKKIILEKFKLDTSLEHLQTVLPQIKLDSTKHTITVIGKNITTGEPASINLSANDYHDQILQHLNQVVLTIRNLFTQLPPAVITDVLDRGILLSGGLAQLQDLPLYLAHALEVPCSVVEQPETTVIRGINIALQKIEEFSSVYGE